MISKGNFEKEHIQEQIKQYPKVDPAKMEMTIFAFGLLDELIRCGLSLIFKSGQTHSGRARIGHKRVTRNLPGVSAPFSAKNAFRKIIVIR